LARPCGIPDVEIQVRGNERPVAGARDDFVSGKDLPIRQWRTRQNVNGAEGVA
jgi:hypothetical protein